MNVKSSKIMPELVSIDNSTTPYMCHNIHNTHMYMQYTYYILDIESSSLLHKLVQSHVTSSKLFGEGGNVLLLHPTPLPTLSYICLLMALSVCG